MSESNEQVTICVSDLDQIIDREHDAKHSGLRKFCGEHLCAAIRLLLSERSYVLNPDED